MDLGEVETEAIDGGVDALDVDILLDRIGEGDLEGFEGADLGDKLEEEGGDVAADADVVVVGAEVLFVLGAVEAVEKFFLLDAGSGLLDLASVVDEGDLGHGRDDGGDGAAIGADGEVFVLEDVGDGDAVGLLKGAVEEGFGDLEADEVAVVFLRVVALGDLDDVEAELGAEMGDGGSWA